MTTSSSTGSTSPFDQPSNSDRIAVFIDRDGVSAKDADRALREVSKHGRVSVLRTYGNLTGRAEDAWANFISSHKDIAHHSANLSQGKNATDIALTIDAIEVLLTSHIDLFVLIVSDADFVPLAHRIRTQGKLLFGFGQKHTSLTFREACNRFWELPSLCAPTPARPRNPIHWTQSPADAEELIVTTLLATSHGNDPVALDRLGQALIKKYPGFDPRIYSRRTLGALLAELPSVELVEHNGKLLARLLKSKD